MTQTVSRKRLEYACTAFLNQMARAYAAEHPDEESPVKTLIDYSPEQRSILMKAVGAAIKSTHTEADKSFDEWVQRQLVDQ